MSPVFIFVKLGNPTQVESHKEALEMGVSGWIIHPPVCSEDLSLGVDGPQIATRTRRWSHVQTPTDDHLEWNMLTTVIHQVMEIHGLKAK